MFELVKFELLRRILQMPQSLALFVLKVYEFDQANLIQLRDMLGSRTKLRNTVAHLIFLAL